MWVSLKTACWPRTCDRPATAPVPRTAPAVAPEPSGSGSDGLFDIGESRSSGQRHGLWAAEGAVEAEIELVLVVGVVGGAGVVVGGTGLWWGCGKRARRATAAGSSGVVMTSLRNSVRMTACRRLVTVELRGCRFWTTIGEDALALGKGGDGGEDGAADELLDALVVGEVEEFLSCRTGPPRVPP